MSVRRRIMVKNTTLAGIGKKGVADDYQEGSTKLPLSETHYPEHNGDGSNVALIIGEDPHTIHVPKAKLLEVEYFMAVFKGEFWTEAAEDKITLPEDEVELWKKAVDFLTKGVLHPRLEQTCECLEDGHCYHEKKWKTGDIQVIDRGGMKIDFLTGMNKIGNWGFPQTTLTLFSDLVGLIIMADKYLWQGLRQACYERLILFPIGPDAFSILLTAPADMERFLGRDIVREAIRYHVVKYDEVGIWDRWSCKDDKYAPYEYLDDYLRENMTADAWTILTQFKDYRLEKRIQFRSSMDGDYWWCGRDRQGVFIDDWNMFVAVQKCLSQSQRSTNPIYANTGFSETGPETSETSNNNLAESISSSTDDLDSHVNLSWRAKSQEDDAAYVRWNSEKCSTLFPDLPFAESRCGDIVTDIQWDVPSSEHPDRRYCTGFNQRTQQRGWFPIKLARLLEQRSRKYCTDGCCEIDIHSSKVRWGRKSRGWRRTGGRGLKDCTLIDPSNNRAWGEICTGIVNMEDPDDNDVFLQSLGAGDPDPAVIPEYPGKPLGDWMSRWCEWLSFHLNYVSG